MFNYITKSIIPIIVFIIITYGMVKGRKVYEWFVEGAKEGLKVCANIFPYLLAMIVAVNIFRSAKLLDWVNDLVEPISSLITYAFIGATGVSISISSKGRSRVTSYAMSVDNSLSSIRKSFVPVFLSLISVSLC